MKLNVTNTVIAVALAALQPVFFASATNPETFCNKGKYGLTDPQTGKIILKAKYDSIYKFQGEYARIRKGNKFGLVKKNGEVYLSCKYHDILFPEVTKFFGKTYFYVSNNGKAYYLQSNMDYYTTYFYHVFYGPDCKWYGINSNGNWINMEGISGFRYVNFKDGAPQIKKVADGYILFNGQMYGPDGKILSKDVDNAERINVAGNEYISVTYNNTIKLIEPRTQIIWDKKSAGLNGVYTASSGDNNYKLAIRDQKLYHIYPYNIGHTELSASKNCETGLWALIGNSGIVLPYKFENIIINQKAGHLYSSNYWIVTLKSKSPASENELKSFAKILRNENENFVIVSEHSMGRSLYGNTGTELVHNTLDNVYFENGFMFVESGGNKSIMGMNGATDLSGYDSIWRSHNSNMLSSDIIVKKNGKIGLYSEGVGEIIPPIYDSLDRGTGYIFVYDNDLEGLYDNNGNKILAPQYKSIKVGAVYMNDRNYFFVKNTNGTSMIVDHTGRTVLQPGLIDRVDFLSGDEGKWCKVYKNGRMGILNLSTFKITVPCAYEDNIFFGEGKWPNRKIGVHKSTSRQELIEIWTMSGRKVASKAFPSSARYTMKHYLESQLNASFYY